MDDLSLLRPNERRLLDAVAERLRVRHLSLAERISRAEGEQPPLMLALGRLKTSAFARGLTDELVREEMQGYNSERRS